MFPNLLQATKEYWCQLDELELAYQKGEIPLKEVDTQVEELMAELALKRRAAFTYFWQSLQNFVVTQKETMIVLAILALLTYSWALTN